MSMRWCPLRDIAYALPNLRVATRPFLPPEGKVATRQGIHINPRRSPRERLFHLQTLW